MVFLIYRILKHFSFSSQSFEASKRRHEPKSSHMMHTALNVVLFPPLFFFSALYYTDVPSLVSVLVCYRYVQYSNNGISPAIWRPRFAIGLIVLAFLALLMRQTNIFWTTVFLGGLDVVRILKAQEQATDHGQINDASFQGVIMQSWKHCTIYDVAVGDAYFEG
jgi:alpha-1,2-glucosyltransferase